MTFIRYKTFGKQEYAYEVESIWDKKTQKPKQKTRYLGVVVDKNKKIFEKRLRLRQPEKLILDFGDSYVIAKLMEKIGFSTLIKEVFSDHAAFVSALLTYRLCYPSAMKYSKNWIEGNYAKLLYNKVKFNSQRISDYFKTLGDEELQRTFFQEYTKRFTNAKKGIVIDATSLPNQIHMPLTRWGRSGEEIDKQIRFLLAVDKQTQMPLFFRYYSGNIVDVSTLKNTLQELNKLDIGNTFIYFDAGYFSEDNIKELQGEKIDFLTRLPSIRCLYKDLIRKHARTLEEQKNITRYGERGLFIKQIEIDLFGKKAYAHMVLDPKRKGREMNKLMVQCVDEKDKQTKELKYRMSTRGIMILVSSCKIKKNDVVPAYYIRQTAEKMFGFSKDDLELLPLRVHGEETLRGFLLMQFLSLALFVKIKENLGQKHTVEELLLAMRNLKCKVYEDEILITEMVKKQKDLTEKLNILMPNKLGV